MSLILIVINGIFRIDSLIHRNRGLPKAAFKELNPADATGLCGMGHLLFSDDGCTYVYGYTRLRSDLYLVKGLR